MTDETDDETDTDTIELTPRQRDRFERIKAECTDDFVPAPTDHAILDSLMDTWDAAGDGYYADGDDLVAAIMDVWDGYDDFDSLDYIGWLIEREAREVRDSEWSNAEKEVADIAICALRTLAEFGDDRDPETIVRERLRDRMAGEQDSIIAREKTAYAAEIRDGSPDPGTGEAEAEAEAVGDALHGLLPDPDADAVADVREVREHAADDAADPLSTVLDELVALRDSHLYERGKARDDGRADDARYFHGKVVTAQTAIDIVRRVLNGNTNVTAGDLVSDGCPDCAASVIGLTDHPDGTTTLRCANNHTWEERWDDE